MEVPETKLNTFNPLEKQDGTDFEVVGSDGVVLYVSKYWYFHYVEKKLDLPISKIGRANLPHKSKILDIIFKCIYYYGMMKGSENIFKEFFEKLDGIDEIYDFFATVDSFKLDGLKNLCDFYYAKDDRIVSLWCTKLVDMVSSYNLMRMRNSIL